MIQITVLVITIFSQIDLCRAHYIRIGSSPNNAPLCLNAELGMYNNRIDGTELTLQPCTGNPNQQFWRYWDQVAAVGKGELIRTQNGLCLNVNLADWQAKKNKADVSLSPCVGNQYNERWSWYGGGWKSMNNGKCLAAESNTVGANVYIINCNGNDDKQLWGLNGFKTELKAGQALEFDEAIYSPNKKWMAYQSRVGPLRLLETRTGIGRWSSNIKSRKSPCRLSLQFDNNLVIYCRGSDIWESNTDKKGALGSNTRLVLQDDRNLVIYDNDGNSIWGSGTELKFTAEDEDEDEDEDDDNTKFPYAWLVFGIGLALFMVVIAGILVMNRRKLRKMVLVLDNEENKEENEDKNVEESKEEEREEEDQQMVQTADVVITSQ